MNITNNITDGMTPQEKYIYFQHMEKRHAEETELLQLKKERLKSYKQDLIEGILNFQTREQFTKEELEKKSTRILERIYDNVQ